MMMDEWAWAAAMAQNTASVAASCKKSPLFFVGKLSKLS